MPPIRPFRPFRPLKSEVPNLRSRSSLPPFPHVPRSTFVLILAQRVKLKLRRCSLFYKWLFHKSYSQTGCGLWNLVLEGLPHEGAASLEGSEVFGLIIGSMVLPHPPEHFEPAFAHAAQSTGVVMALVPFGLVIRLGPVAGFAAFVGPQMDRMAQEMVADEADARLGDLAGLIGHGADAGLTHQAVGVGKDLAHRADQAEEPRPQGLFGPGQRTKNVMIGVLGEGLGDARTILLDLPLEGLQHIDQAQGQQAFSTDDRRAGIELLAARPTVQPFGGRLRPPQFVDVKEILPFPSAGIGQSRRRGKGSHEGPGEGFGPLIEAFQGQGIVFAEGRLELIDQGGAVFDEGDLIAAEQTQGGGRLVLGAQRTPGMAVGAQGIGFGPGIVAIALSAAGRLARAVLFGGQWVERIEAVAPLKQLVHSHAGGGFDGHWTFTEGLHLLAKRFPSFGGVIETKIGDDGLDPIHDDDVVVILSPIEGCEIRLFIPVSVHSTSGAQRRWHLGRARPDIGALVGRSSLSAWPRGRRRSRQSTDNPRGVWSDEPWLRGGQLFTAAIVAGGKVIHHLRAGALAEALPSMVNNFGKHIRSDMIVAQGQRGTSATLGKRAPKEFSLSPSRLAGSGERDKGRGVSQFDRRLSPS